MMICIEEQHNQHPSARPEQRDKALDIKPPVAAVELYLRHKFICHDIFVDFWVGMVIIIFYGTDVRTITAQLIASNIEVWVIAAVFVVSLEHDLFYRVAALEVNTQLVGFQREPSRPVVLCNGNIRAGQLVIFSSAVIVLNHFQLVDRTFVNLEMVHHIKVVFPLPFEPYKHDGTEAGGFNGDLLQVFNISADFDRHRRPAPLCQLLIE